MKLKRPDLSQLQPLLPEYFRNVKENLSQYCSTFQPLHPEVDDPVEEETDEVALMVAGHGQEHDRMRILSGVRN
jgi:hypothetical protein